MVAKCANPTCSARFLYLHEGELFAVEFNSDSPGRVRFADPEYIGHSHSCEYFWLCSSCCSTMTVQFDRDHGIILVPKRKMSSTVSVTKDSPPIAV